MTGRGPGAKDWGSKGTVAAIQRELMVDGLVHRYPPEGSEKVDGLPPGEGTFVACTFWLADNLALQGQTGEARALFERLLALANDVGLLAEEYDPQAWPRRVSVGLNVGCVFEKHSRDIIRPLNVELTDAASSSPSVSSPVALRRADVFHVAIRSSGMMCISS